MVSYTYYMPETPDTPISSSTHCVLVCPTWITCGTCETPCLFLCAHMFICKCMCTLVYKGQKKVLDVVIISTLFCDTGSLSEPKAHQFTKPDWLTCPKYPPISIPPPQSLFRCSLNFPASTRLVKIQTQI